MKIIYSPSARRDLDKILDYYFDIGNRIKGKKIRAKLILTTANLREYPRLGKKDAVFSIKYQQVCYFLVCDNHKIVYKIQEEESIYVLRFYDTRQNS